MLVDVALYVCPALLQSRLFHDEQSELTSYSDAVERYSVPNASSHEGRSEAKGGRFWETGLPALGGLATVFNDLLAVPAVVYIPTAGTAFRPF